MAVGEYNARLRRSIPGVPLRLLDRPLPTSTMASSTLRSRTKAETGGVVLPTDVIYEILIRVPAKELCRLRVVCQPWRSLLSEAQFIAAHADRHQLIVTGRGKSHPGGGILCCIQDLSGTIIKSIRSKKDEWLISTQCNLACVARGDAKQCQLINLFTGERFSMPRGLSREHTHRRLEFLKYRISVAFGQVASTGEFKLLRVIDNNFATVPCEQICEVFTHGGSRGARWRGKKVALDGVIEMSSLSKVVIDGFVYFLLVEYVSKQRYRTKGIASFDLLTEEWRAILRRPPIIKSGGCFSSLAALNGSLVLVHCSPCASMDLWFLMDFEKGLWVKQHTVEINLLAGEVDYFAHPLVILKNGRIVIYIRSRVVLTIYNPRTNTCTDVAKKLGYRVRGVGLYTGKNLLSLANDAI